MRNTTLTKKDYEMIASEIIRQVFEPICAGLASLVGSLIGCSIGFIIIWAFCTLLGIELV